MHAFVLFYAFLSRICFNSERSEYRITRWSDFIPPKDSRTSPAHRVISFCLVQLRKCSLQGPFSDALGKPLNRTLSRSIAALGGRGLQISSHNILLPFHNRKSAWQIHLERAGSRLVFYLFRSSEKDSPPRDRRSHRLPLGWDKIPLGLHHQPQKSQQK